MMREHVAARQHLLEGEQHFLQRHLRRNAHHLAVDQLGGRHPGIALQARHAVDALGRALEALVLLQPAHELGARIGFLAASGRVHTRQQHARLDLGERRGHQQIFAGQLELQHLHQLDVARVLAGDLGDRNVEDVEILPPDQIQQQIERALEGLEEHLERLRRDVQVARQLGDGLALHHRERHFGLRAGMRACAGAAAGGVGVFGTSVRSGFIGLPGLQR